MKFDVAPDTAVLWTGGKDSALAMYEAAQSGYRIRCLVTFAPPEPDFLAHPIPVMKMQAEALGLPHHVISVSTPFDKGYETALCHLKDGMSIDCVITGDIAQIGDNPNWIQERSRAVGMNAHMLLWGRERNFLLRQLLENKFKVRISCVDTHRLDASWVGRELDDAAIDELLDLQERTGLDACGEQGEYHTVVVDGPLFRQPVEIGEYSIQTAGPLAYMQLSDNKSNELS